MKENPKKIWIGAFILVLCAGTVFGFKEIKQSRKETHASAAVSGKVRGPDSAPVRVIDFSDFQCPACRAAAPMLEYFMEKYPGKIQLVFKHFPLRMHAWSAPAHQAGECAAEQGKFWEFYRKIYENQPIWSSLPDPLVSFAAYAKESGLDMVKFTSCMTDGAVAERIAAEKKEGENLEVRSTPTFFINGKMFAGPQELQMGAEAHIRQILQLPPEKPAASQPVQKA